MSCKKSDDAVNATGAETDFFLDEHWTLMNL